MSGKNGEGPTGYVHVELGGVTHFVGRVWLCGKARETATFEYDTRWLTNAERFALGPALATGVGPYGTLDGRTSIGAVGDSAPYRMGRTLLRRAWCLARPYDLNPVPLEAKPRILETSVDVNSDNSAALDPALLTAEHFALRVSAARRIGGEIARAVARWRQTAKKKSIPRWTVENRPLMDT